MDRDHKQKSLKQRLQLGSREYMRVGGAIFAYMFHRITQRELLALIEDKEVAERVLEVVRSDGYTLKNCKLFAHAYWAARQSGETKPRATQYEIHPEDISLLKRINLSHVSSTYVPMSLEDMDSMIEGALDSPEMRAYIGRYISKKMIFLVRSYNVPRKDIEGDLMRAALAAIYKTYPKFESALHFTNVAKSAIHNSGMSLIAYHTRASRTRIVLNEEGFFRAVNDSSEQLVDMLAPESYMDHAKDALQSLVKLAPRMSEKVQQFLLAAAGHHNSGLSEFMRCDNSDAVDTMQYPQYLQKVQTYFGVTEPQVARLFCKLRSQLAA